VHQPSVPECAELIFAAMRQRRKHRLDPHIATFRRPAHLSPHVIVGMEADGSTDRSLSRDPWSLGRTARHLVWFGYLV
jgi:hypothetical protein